MTLSAKVNLLLAAAAASVSHAQGVFVATGSDTVPRYFHSACRLPNGLVMVTGGLGLQLLPPSLYSRDDISFYDPDTETFSASFQPLGGGPATTPTLLTPRSSQTQTTLEDGRVLITGGRTGASGTSPGTAAASVEIFDPQTGLVSAGPSMGSARAAHTATLLPDGRVLVAGGSSWQIFTPGPGTWSANATLARSRTGHAAVLLPDFAGVAGDDRVLLIGGTGSGPDTMEIVDPNATSTQLLASTLAVGGDDLAAVRLGDGRVLIVGGQDATSGDTVADCYLLDPVGDVLTPIADLPDRAGGIADHKLLVLAGFPAVFGGEQQQSGTDTILDYARIFDPDTGEWIDPGASIFLHDDFAAVPLSDRTVLLIDGGVPLLGQEAPAANCERFTMTIGCGDANGDLNVDITDLGIVLSDFGMTGDGLEGDVDYDGDVDITDLGYVLACFGHGCE